MTVDDRPWDVGVRKMPERPRMGGQLAPSVISVAALEVPMTAIHSGTAHRGDRDAATVALTEGHSALTEVLGEASRFVSDEPGLLELTSRACAAATSLLSGVSWASVMAQLDARPVTVAATDLRALLLDHAQYREDDGPGLH